ncbi:MAG: type IVB secretion system protein IcmH/DotU, partial [Pseudomonadota bacterium]
MVNDDPFGLSDEAARTRFQPLERRAPAQAAPEPPAAPRGSRAHPNRLIAAFGPLLEAAPALQTERPPEDVGALRGRLQKELVEARDAAIGRGVPASLTDKGLWCVAALVDDIVLNTPWGAHGDWARRSIVAELFGQVDAGERFFDRLDATERQAARDGELLELMYLCLSLGFRGKFRVREAQERRGLEELRGGVARMIRRPELADRPLAPRWQGIDAPDADPRFIVPLWVVGVTALALLIAIYAGLAFRLGGEVEALPSMAGAILPAER